MAFSHQESTANRRRRLAYWVEKLADMPLLKLPPTDRPRPSRPSYRGRHHHFRLPAALVAEIRRFARERRATPYAVLFTAHALLLARYSRQSDFVVTMPVDGRIYPELTTMLGCFTKLLPIRCRIDPEAGLAANVDRMFDELLDGATFQAAPFHRIVGALGGSEATRDAALAKLFRSLFVLNSFNRDRSFETEEITAEITVEADHDVAKTDLSFSLQEIGEEIAVRIEYATELFDRTRSPGWRATSGASSPRGSPIPTARWGRSPSCRAKSSRSW